MKCKHTDCHYWLYYRYDQFNMKPNIIYCQRCIDRIPPSYIPEYQHVKWIRRKYNIEGKK